MKISAMSCITAFTISLTAAHESLTGPGVARGEYDSLTGPGAVSGEYETDRWGRDVFGGRLLSPGAAAALEPYRGASVSAEVSALGNCPYRAGPGTILTVGRITPLTNAPALKLTISAPPCTREGESTSFELSFSNLSGRAVSLWPGWDMTELFIAGGADGSPPSTGGQAESFRFRAADLVAGGTGIEAVKGGEGGQVSVLPGGQFRFVARLKAPLPAGRYQAWWRVYHSSGPMSGGHPARSPRADFDVAAPAGVK